MTPEQYVPKVLGEVTVMQYNAWDGTGNDVKNWIVGLLETAFSPETISINDNGNGTFEMHIGEIGDEFLFKVESGQYVYLDEDGFHVASQGAFEMIYQKKPPA